MAFQHSINDFCYLFGGWLFNPFAPLNRCRIITHRFQNNASVESAAAASVFASVAAAVVSAVELDPQPVSAEAATTAAIANAVTFFIISISPQILLFFGILPFMRDPVFQMRCRVTL